MRVWMVITILLTILRIVSRRRRIMLVRMLVMFAFSLDVFMAVTCAYSMRMLNLHFDA